jgi:hypothetical protein
MTSTQQVRTHSLALAAADGPPLAALDGLEHRLSSVMVVGLLTEAVFHRTNAASPIARPRQSRRRGAKQFKGTLSIPALAVSWGYRDFTLSMNRRRSSSGTSTDRQSLVASVPAP